MKKGDFIAWRYTHENHITLTITRFGIFEGMDTANYIIRDIKTGKTQKIPQYQIAIVYSGEYDSLKNVENIETIVSNEEMKNILINNQDEEGV